MLGVALIGCGSSATVSTTPATPSPAPTTTARTVFVPPGVDSSAAYHADSLAEESFVSLDQQEEAAARAEEGRALTGVSDTLWQYLEMSSDTSQSVSQERANDAVRAFNRGAQALVEYQEITQAAELDSTQLVQMQARLLDRAQQAFEEAIQLNPYDDPTRSALAQVYTLQAQRLGRQAAYQRSIDILEKLTRLRQDQPGLFSALANNYYETEQWGQAAANYGKAREAYVSAVELSLEGGAQLDSTRMYNYATAEADAHVYDRDPAAALQTYELAQQYATIDEQQQFVQGEIAWVNWDDGNIDASFARDSLASLAGQGQHAAAAQGFRALKPQLRTPSARDEIDWRLAQAEYQNDKQDQAASRLQALVQRTETDSTGVPADSTYQRYFDDYVTICYNLGQRYRNEERDLRTALKYFEQATRVASSRRALAALEAGKLLRNNVRRSVEYLEMALEEREALSVDDQRDLYRQLVDRHRRLGNRQEALTYRDRFRALAQPSNANNQ